MIITCEECQTKFRVADELIKLTGTRVRCSNCQSVFTVFRPPQTLNPAQESRFDLDNLERTSLERTNLERNSLERNSPDQSFPEVLDQDLADLFAPDAPPSPQPPAAGPPVILARPPYPASRPLFAVDPALDPHFKDIASPLSPIPTPPNLRPPANLGLDDEPVATSLIKAPPPAPSSPAPSSPAPELNEAWLTPPPDPGSAPFENPEPIGPSPSGSPEIGGPPPPRLREREKTSRRQKLFLLSAAVIIAFLIIGVLILSIVRKPGEVALQTPGRPAPAAPSAMKTPNNPTPNPPDETTLASKINFVQDQESHHYRVNQNAGRLLIISGRVTNGYPTARSFIRIKGSLKNGAGEVVATRQVYAGNYLTEDELINLPMREILARLALKGGQDNANVNVPPNQAVGFMLVFDRLPDDLAEYILEPAGSNP